MKYEDPKIPVSEALAQAGGNQSELARKLGIGRAAVNKWLVEEREYLPPLTAYRYQQISRKSA